MSSFEHAYRGVRVRGVTGDITKLKVDAIVNPANTLMFMGGGVAGAIKRVGVAKIESEALKKAPVKVGEAIVTTHWKASSKICYPYTTMIDLQCESTRKTFN